MYKTPGGFEALPHGDRLYYLVNVLSGEVYNGGFDQFFSNSSGDRYVETIAALHEVGAHACLALLQEAKAVLFGHGRVPAERTARYKLMATSSKTHPSYDDANSALDELDRKFYADPDKLSDVLDQIATTHRLYPRDA